MLSPYAADAVRATIPVVAQYQGEMTRKFYGIMAATHPPVLQAFDRGFQEAGVDREALMSAVLHYARRLVDMAAVRDGGNVSEPSGLESPGLRPVIAAYHASGLTPDQVLIAARVLSKAFTEVLGDRTTPEIARHWDQVFWLFATSSIADDAMRYQHGAPTEEVPWRPWTVIRREDEATDTMSFTLIPADGGPTPGFAPGQYAAVAVNFADGTRHLRHYTLARGRKPGTIRITVRRLRGYDGAPDGLVSTYLHDRVGEGETLDVGPFVGDVTLDTSMVPLILISAGVGITYTAALLDDVAENQPTRKVISVHADRSPGSHALMSEIALHASQLTDFTHYTWYEAPDAGPEGSEPEAGVEPDVAGQVRWGRVKVQELTLPSTGQIYLCGPLGFMNDVRNGLIRIGHNPHRIHYEVFGADLWARRHGSAGLLVPNQEQSSNEEHAEVPEGQGQEPDPAWSW
jgi:nitric oxide dioxygenase